MSRVGTIVVSFELGKSEPRNIYVTTIGRVSGLPREIEIWFVTLHGKYFIMAESPRAHWIRNIKRNTRVKVRIEDRQAKRSHVCSTSRTMPTSLAPYAA